eukprot:TRINITY_DN60737_c0_g1_i1.p1 TRINITY_DN60737_c0_g1~~TRINITY_DN60737_c0_g1_i1.p1  ORF type:complete len:126 (-),score=27.24 TRINITY_DN60737_c0_g1_i1:135-512(-)
MLGLEGKRRKSNSFLSPLIQASNSNMSRFHVLVLLLLMVFTVQTIEASRLTNDVIRQKRSEASSAIASFIAKIHDLGRQLEGSRSTSSSKSVEESSKRRILGASPSPGIGHSFVNGGRKVLEVHF